MYLLRISYFEQNCLSHSCQQPVSGVDKCHISLNIELFEIVLPAQTLIHYVFLVRQTSAPW